MFFLNIPERDLGEGVFFSTLSIRTPINVTSDGCKINFKIGYVFSFTQETNIFLPYYQQKDFSEPLNL